MAPRVNDQTAALSERRRLAQTTRRQLVAKGPISIEEVRELLGPAADGKTDAELERVRDRLYGFAGLLLRSYRSSSGQA